MSYNLNPPVHVGTQDSVLYRIAQRRKMCRIHSPAPKLVRSVLFVLLTLVFATIVSARGQSSKDEVSQYAQSSPGGETPQPDGTKPSAQAEPEPERWNLFYQATSIGQYHGRFHSPYEGLYSLRAYPERDVSLTTTFFLGLRLGHDTEVYVDPEIAGGRGFSGVAGIANFPNGEMPRVTTAAPKPYIARAFLVHDFGFSTDKEAASSGENQLAGGRPVTRYTLVIGKFSITDFFDNNRYTHDPRKQFMGWAIMYNGAWDYPADTRGYTWGWVHEFHTRRWSLRYASSAEPRVANGLRFDRRVLRDRGDIFEGEARYSLGGHDGAIRWLGFLHHTHSGTYSEALRISELTGTAPDVAATRRVGTLKYGTGINVEQEITKNIGVFGRLGWNDGKTESFAFTAIDRLSSGGISIMGARWKRPNDVAASALTVSGISGVHALYLARGGLDFNIGDGRLRYGPEYVSESYYSAQLAPWLTATIDLQRIVNPAFNRDRGPLWIPSLRLHLELSKETFSSGK